MKCNPYSNSTRFLIITFSLFFVGCSKIWIQPESNNQAQDDSSLFSADVLDVGQYSKTTIGAVAGATIGAVTGLAIGSTSGNAGEGFLLGSAAGAAAGAGIGHALEGQQSKLASQQEIVRQQDEIIKKQGQEIEELRKSVTEGKFPISSYNSSSLGRSFGGGYGGNPKAIPFGASDSRARMSGTEVVKRQRQALREESLTAPVAPRTSRVAVNPKDLRVKQSAPQAKLAGLTQKAPPAVVNKPPMQIATNSLPPARDHEAVTSLDPAPAPKPITVGAGTKKAMPAKIVSKPVAKKEIAKKTEVKPVKQVVKKVEEKQAAITVAKATPDSDSSANPKESLDGCKQAVSEANRGRKATSDADTLFYFRRAIRLCPSEPNYYVEVGKVYVSIGRTEDAQHEFNKALELDPENEAAQNELSMIMLGAAY